MLLEDYFDFLSPDDIHIKGHRIGIQDVIKYYLSGYSPKEILEELPSLNLEKIYAVITYYWRNRSQIDEYMFLLEQSQEQHYQERLKQEPSEAIARLRANREQTKKKLLLIS
ncbi:MULTISPECIES: DUF433 domain-containing protein [Pseudanabaena]|uniref:DUF433 domain-containing protein n=1 Tax=Pseudanabaena TaxID=1152 RepID=UPI002478DE3B|nr:MULTISPECIES: DUF433 domain-containing protein [Pseudanabaena]MEA5488308.1 DUF433 domain-containing protein [Pseudanabaena sp. CCNP1317]WGS72865.1 DUF433 domain-containing protein [Pseudanabaena galeata CCNP1313]